MPSRIHADDLRGRAIALIAAWVHDEANFPAQIIERTPAAVRLSEAVARDKRPNVRDVEQLLDSYEDNLMLNREIALVAAALLRCWAGEISVPPKVLLADIALGQALDSL